MKTVSVDVPESLLLAADRLAHASGITISQLFTAALREKLDALTRDEWVKNQAAMGDRARFLEALQQVPDHEPDEADRL